MKIFHLNHCLNVSESSEVPEGHVALYYQNDPNAKTPAAPKVVPVDHDLWPLLARQQQEAGPGEWRVKLGCGLTLQDFLREYSSQYVTLMAGGGVVLNPKDEVLLIYRKEMWDLPKGKVDEGETVSETALREVGEETGAEGLSILQDLEPTYHIYQQKGQWHLKTTYWYIMRATGPEKLKPQAEEDITEARWVSQAEAQTLTADTYPSIRQVMTDFQGKYRPRYAPAPGL